MEKTMTVAVIIVALFWAIGGMEGGMLVAALAVPIGIVLTFVGLAMGWFEE